MSTISAGTSTGTALVSTGDTTGALVLKTNGSTTALTLGTDQSATFVGAVTAPSFSGTSSTATNLAGGSNGTIPYQSASGTTQMLAVGTSGQVLQTNGAGAPSWVTVASGLSGASQAEMEGASSTTVAVTPGVAQYHPSASKCWIKCTRSTINASYNVASITDIGTGQVRINLATSFSSANYAILVTPYSGSGGELIIPLAAAQTSGNFRVEMRDGQGGSVNPTAWMAVAFGDQA